jgi:lysophospholipase L1-like esterase
MHRPWHSLLFALLVFGLVLGIGALLPQELVIGAKLAFRFPQASVIFWEGPARKDISALLKTVEVADSGLLVSDPHSETTMVRTDSVARLITALQYRDSAVMHAFYSQLGNLKGSGRSLRVLHYGDSQIEGDRITGYLREKLQLRFGGEGPGLTSVLPLTQNYLFFVDAPGDWERYNAGNGRDPRVPHDDYGPMAGFCRFRPYMVDTHVVSASVTIRPGKHFAKKGAGFGKIKLLYGGGRVRTWCGYYEDGRLLRQDSLAADGNRHTAEYAVTNPFAAHRFDFRGADSPDLYGISLEGAPGVMVDNIPLRGSSGTFFHVIDNAQLRAFYSDMNVRLLILQFGGNALPAITDSVKLRNYGNYLRGQIAIVKKLAPAASILFIGPSDMSVKSGTDYVTHPFLEPLRDVLRDVSFGSGCAFFDLYDCMGGKNSMPSWVDQKLAASDYTHFSPEGARKIAALFYTALINDYNHYLKTRK